MRGYLTAAAGALVLSTSIAFAQGATLTEGHLDAVDTSDDNSVSLDELKGYMSRAFAALDKDADGVVTWVEAEAAMIRDTFDTIDKNKDGNMTPAELDAQATADFAASDRDGNGALN